MQGDPVCAGHVLSGNEPFDLLVVAFFIDKIEILDLKDQDRIAHLALKELEIGVLNTRQIVFGNALLIVPAPFFDAVEKLRRRPVQVDEQIRARKVVVQDMEQSLKQTVFFFVQILAGEDDRLPEAIVGHDEFIEQRTFEKIVLQLFVPLRHKEQFDRKCMTDGIFVEIRQEGIVGKILEDELAVIFPADQFTQGGFASSDITLDADVLIWERWNHASPKIVTSP